MWDLHWVHTLGMVNVIGMYHRERLLQNPSEHVKEPQWWLRVALAY